MICLATAFILASGETQPLPPLAAPLLAVGDRSYSLYLVHWPIFALLNNVFITPVPTSWNVMALGLSFAFCEILYRGVEQRFRHITINRHALAVLVLLPLLAVGSAALLVLRMPAAVLEARSANFGLAAACISQRQFVPKEACRTGAQPEMLLWATRPRCTWRKHLPIPVVPLCAGNTGVLRTIPWRCTDAGRTTRSRLGESLHRVQ